MAFFTTKCGHLFRTLLSNFDIFQGLLLRFGNCLFVIEHEISKILAAFRNIAKSRKVSKNSLFRDSPCSITNKECLNKQIRHQHRNPADLYIIICKIAKFWDFTCYCVHIVTIISRYYLYLKTCKNQKKFGFLPIFGYKK